MYLFCRGARLHYCRAGFVQKKFPSLEPTVTEINKVGECSAFCFPAWPFLDPVISAYIGLGMQVTLYTSKELDGKLSGKLFVVAFL